MTRTLPIFLLLTAPIWAQTPSLNCDNSGHDGRLASYCEMREQTIANPGKLNIDAAPNGGISVRGWNRGDVLVRAKVDSAAASDAEAKSLASQVFLHISGGTISASGPTTTGHDSHWSVSWEVFAPTNSDVSANTVNGGIHLQDVRGQINFRTVNGGVHLSGLGGNVQGSTSNGGVHVELAGNRWDGQGLDVKSSNGGVHLSMPANYSAHLETGTTNGGLKSDLPGIVKDRRQTELSVDVGSGGPTIRVYTTNGGVSIDRKGATI